MTSGGRPSGGRIGRNRGPIQCYICQQFGHFAKDCRRGRTAACYNQYQDDDESYYLAGLYDQQYGDSYDQYGGDYGEDYQYYDYPEDYQVEEPEDGDYGVKMLKDAGTTTGKVGAITIDVSAATLEAATMKVPACGRQITTPVDLVGRNTLRNVPALLDTGCQFAALVDYQIALDLYRGLETAAEWKRVFQPANVTAYQAGDDPIEIRSQFTLLVKTEGRTAEIDAYVASKLGANKVILGPPCLSALGYQMTGPTGKEVLESASTFQISTPVIHNNQIYADTEHRILCGKVMIAEKKKPYAPGMQSIKVKVSAPKAFAGKECIFEPDSELFEVHGITIPECIVKIQENGFFTLNVDNILGYHQIPTQIAVGTVQEYERLMSKEEAKTEVMQAVLNDVTTETAQTAGVHKGKTLTWKQLGKLRADRQKLLLEKLNLKEANLTEEQRREMEEFFPLHDEVFALYDNELGCCDWVLGESDTQGTPPIKIPPRRVPYSVRQAIDKQINELLEMDIIEDSNSPYSFPIVPIKKKMGEV